MASTDRTFSVLSGDANSDGIVDFSDLLSLAQNYGTTTGRTFSQGNVDYSADGVVGFDDLLILAQHYGSSTPVATPLRAVKKRVASELLANQT